MRQTNDSRTLHVRADQTSLHLQLFSFPCHSPLRDEIFIKFLAKISDLSLFSYVNCVILNGCQKRARDTQERLFQVLAKVQLDFCGQENLQTLSKANTL